MRNENEYYYGALLRVLESSQAKSFMEKKQIYDLYTYFTPAIYNSSRDNVKTVRGALSDFIMTKLGYGTDIFQLLTRLPAGMFYQSKNLPESFVIPNNITFLEDGVFIGAELGSVLVSARCSIIPNSCFFKSTIKEIKFESTTIQTISANAFHSCTELTKVTLPNNLNTVLGGAFLNCPKLQEIIFPDNISQISGDAFDGNSPNLKIKLPSSFNDPEKLAKLFTRFKLTPQKQVDTADKLTEYIYTHIEFD